MKYQKGGHHRERGGGWQCFLKATKSPAMVRNPKRIDEGPSTKKGRGEERDRSIVGRGSGARGEGIFGRWPRLGRLEP